MMRHAAATHGRTSLDPLQSENVILLAAIGPWSSAADQCTRRTRRPRIGWNALATSPAAQMPGAIIPSSLSQDVTGAPPAAITVGSHSSA